MTDMTKEQALAMNHWRAIEEMRLRNRVMKLEEGIRRHQREILRQDEPDEVDIELWALLDGQ